MFVSLSENDKSMRTLRLIIVLAAFIFAASDAQAQYNRPGSTSAEFLRIGVSARAAGMADAYLAVADGPEAVHYNVSALPWQGDGLHITANHLEWFSQVNHEYIGVSKSFGNVGSFGASLTMLYTDAMKVRTPLQQEGTGETFHAYNMRASLGYARWFTDRVTFGGTVSFVNVSLYGDFQQSAVALDIATSYRSDYRDFRFGVKIANIGSDLKFVNETYPLPILFVFGARMNAVELNNQIVRVAGAVSKPNDGEPVGRVGLEYAFQDLLFLRGGYRINYTTARFAFGGGVKFSVGERSAAADYAYVDYAELGAAHQVGLKITL